MPLPVSDIRSNKQEQLAHAAEVLQKSANRQKVFEAIYRGKRRVKRRSEIETQTGLDNKQVLTAAKFLVDHQLATQERLGAENAYGKDPFYAANRDRILVLARDPAKLKAQPRASHTRSAAANVTFVQIASSPSFKPPKLVTIDEIDSFSLVTSVAGPLPKRVQISERVVKDGVREVLGETSDFRDWGGERNDLVTTRLRLYGRRRAAAFAFKGPGASGPLTPAKMGKNGDQIQRLVESEAEIFVVQYVGQIGEMVMTQLAALTVAKAAVTGKQLFYAVIDGQDTARIVKAYPGAFPGVSV